MKVIGHSLLAAAIVRGAVLRSRTHNPHRGSSMGLVAPRVVALRRGAFHDWMKGRGKLGAQNKVPRVVMDEKARAALEQFALAQAPPSTTLMPGTHGSSPRARRKESNLQ